MKQHDILLELNGQPLKQASELADAVDAAEQKPLSLKFTRQGKTQSITVMPGTRPAEGDTIIIAREKEFARRTLTDALRRVEEVRDESQRQLKEVRDASDIVGRVEHAAGGPLRLRLFRKGWMVHSGPARILRSATT